MLHACINNELSKIIALKEPSGKEYQLITKTKVVVKLGVSFVHRPIV